MKLACPGVSAFWSRCCDVGRDAEADITDATRSWQLGFILILGYDIDYLRLDLTVFLIAQDERSRQADCTWHWWHKHVRPRLLHLGTSPELLRNHLPSSIQINIIFGLLVQHTMVFGLPVFLNLNYLLSVPLVSYFLLPTTTTGWSTYLNLLFFSLAWTSLVWTQPPLAVEFLSILLTRIFCFVLPSALFLGFDLSVPTAARSLKARDGALPFEAAGESRPAKSQTERLARIVGLALFNTVLGVLLQTGIDFLFTDLLHLRSVLKISSRLPTPWTLVLEIVKALISRGVLMYYIHRFLLHNRRNSPHLTRAHESYAHSLSNALPFAAAYDHPAAYLLHRWIPIYLPAFVFRMHIFTYMIFTAIVSLEETFVFSGYQALPSTIILTGMARRQERHVMSGGKGNFAPYGILDLLHGTNLDDGDVVNDLQQEARKRDVKGKTNKAVDAAKDAVDKRQGSSNDEVAEEEADANANGNGGRRRKTKK